MKIILIFFFKEVIECIEKEGTKCSFYRSYYWGIYEIISDTIITQSINHVRSLNQYYAGAEKKYLILDKNTIRLIESIPLNRTRQYSAYELSRRAMEEIEFEKVFERKRVDSDTARYVPLEKIPPSDCWLKRKQWLWCDKEEFKKWEKENR